MSSSDGVDWSKPIPDVEVNMDDLEDNELGGFTLNGELFTGIAVSYHPGGQLESRRPCLNSLPHGLCQWWFSSGKPQKALTTYRGAAHGWETRWYDNGQVAERIYSEFGRPLEWTEFDEEGHETSKGSNRENGHTVQWIERNRKLFPDAP